MKVIMPLSGPAQRPRARSADLKCVSPAEVGCLRPVEVVVADIGGVVAVQRREVSRITPNAIVTGGVPGLGLDVGPDHVHPADADLVGSPSMHAAAVRCGWRLFADQRPEHTGQIDPCATVVRTCMSGQNSKGIRSEATRALSRRRGSARGQACREVESPT